MAFAQCYRQRAIPFFPYGWWELKLRYSPVKVDLWYTDLLNSCSVHVSNTLKKYNLLSYSFSIVNCIDDQIEFTWSSNVWKFFWWGQRMNVSSMYLSHIDGFFEVFHVYVGQYWWQRWTHNHQYKFLGITLDLKLSFISHINLLRIKCNQTIHLLKTKAHTGCGVDKKTLIKLYRCLIQSKLNYSCFVSGAAQKSFLWELETIHHQGLCTVLGAFITSSFESLYKEANKLLLSLRRYKLALQYYAKLISCPQKPGYYCIIEIRYKNLFENKAKTIKPFNLRIQTLLNEIKMYPKIIHNTIPLKIAPWTINQPIIKLEVTKLSNPHIYFQKTFINIQNNFIDHPYLCRWIQTGNESWLCCFLQKQELLKRLPNESSIYSAEVTAIALAMNITAHHKSSKFIIHSDSKSILSSTEQKYINSSHYKTARQNEHSF